ncbi:endonuclease/exonuclease/phosphatase family protein [Stieleria sp. TO1_6]|uniref:endonuclease/exonuclease/phosphatase family protein n=1 Tax=Stieleria tagensis TaxID=2956795 RepID=UPI00209A65A7|nr:endonuclease/exonuclease/phosphatase family protein [Stieleria tagensis]MCO8120606.1 endonuclease/exonuclease/phosphatase family protein [Stieleria tagensis]
MAEKTIDSDQRENESVFRVVTYNIHKGIGGIDRRYRPQRIIDALAHCEADIVLMQEVDDNVPRSKFDYQVELFSDALGMKHHAFRRTVQLKQGHYGNAILSRFPISEVFDVDLTIPFKKSRRALLAHCKLRHLGHERTLWIANVHLGLAGFERKIQLRRLLQNDLLRRTHRKTPLVIAGDFNDVWGSLGKQIMHPAEFAIAGPRIKTFPAAVPVRGLDRVFYRGDLQVDHAFSCRTEISRQASDHLPLVVDFRLLTEPHE